MYDLISIAFKYIFVIIIYLFIFTIIRMIYLDLKTVDYRGEITQSYLKLLNRIDSLPFSIKDSYSIGDELTLGRSSSNNIVIKDPYISKNHFKIIKDEENFFIEDLKSSNGTFLNGEKLEDVAILKSNDVIRTGEIEFIFLNKPVEEI
ncbi:MAG: FHA domain-containing protein [Tissierellia bacterium]|nr:FHA domain-containing protein [Tissierellia bacterium]